ncbi:signal peptidase II [Rivibacter subsaxonicus]|uniref:Lipoprotein signal peptidase n=1 Tax=Rivibacter subsaxonicus TaxID=457575 RepID=A0A4Q7W2B6_9BURK|nr:signal peptidase II [Rivibacter subsaxonicus]RZU02749.1 signal peptidase II [Rivibacter subsaxonicus]
MARATATNRDGSRSTTGSGLLFWLLIAALVVVADQLTKFLIVRSFNYGDVREVTSFFNVVRVHNTGAAFSFLAGASGWQRWFFVALGLAFSAFCIVMLRSHGATQKRFAWGLTLIMGGAIGNVIDRLVHGYVVDFLDFHFRFLAPLFPGGHFPAFNLADAAITLGAMLLIVDEVQRVRGKP